VLVVVVTVDGDLGDQAVELGVGSADAAHSWGPFTAWLAEAGRGRVVGSGSHALEAADGLVHANGGGLVVEVDDRSADAVEVAGAGVVVDADAVADAELGERLG